MDEAFKVLSKSRPTTINLQWALKQMRTQWKKAVYLTSGEIADTLLCTTNKILADNLRINQSIGALGAKLLSNNTRILTYCSSGALATSGHGTAPSIILLS